MNDQLQGGATPEDKQWKTKALPEPHQLRLAVDLGAQPDKGLLTIFNANGKYRTFPMSDVMIDQVQRSTREEMVFKSLYQYQCQFFEENKTDLRSSPCSKFPAPKIEKGPPIPISLTEWDHEAVDELCGQPATLAVKFNSPQIAAERFNRCVESIDRAIDSAMTATQLLEATLKAFAELAVGHVVDIYFRRLDEAERLYPLMTGRRLPGSNRTARLRQKRIRRLMEWMDENYPLP
ncbi:MAG: hypothetical protein SFV32_12595 [Opitutaceae bacterium]|nr:hypothetical protein [Opitutaceae bacterium]